MPPPRSTQTVLEALGFGEVIWRLEDEGDDASLVLEHANSAACEIAGKSLSELVGSRIDDAFPTLRGDGVPEVLARIAREAVPVRVDRFRYSAAEGDRWLHAAGLPVDGRRVRVVFEDVTSQRQLEDSLQFQALLLENVDQAVIATDLEQRVVVWNRFAEQLYGWSATEVIGRRIVDVLGAPGFEARGEEIMEQVSAGRSWAGEVAVRGKSGKTFSIYSVTSPIMRGGKLVGLVGVSHELTEQKRVEEELRRSEARHRALLSAIPDGVFHLNHNGRYIDYFGSRQNLQLPPEEFLGQRIRDVLDAPLSAILERAISDALRAPRPVTVEHGMLIDGEERAFESTFARSGQNEVVAVARDVTARKRDRDAIERLLAETEEKVEERTRDLRRLNFSLLEQVSGRREAEDALRDSYAHLRTLINASPAPIIEMTRNGTVLLWSDAAERFFGWSASETEGRFNPIIPEDKLRETEGIRSAVFSGATLRSVLVDRQTRSGERIKVTLSAAPVRGSDGRITKAVFVFGKPESERMSAEVEMLSAKLAGLKTLAAAVAATLDLNGALYVLQNELSIAHGITAGVVFDYEGDQFVRRHAWGLSPEVLDGIGEIGAIRGHGLVSDDKGHRWLSAQLLHGTEETGLLLLSLPADTTKPGEIEILLAVAHESANALASARLFEEVRRGHDRLHELSRRLVSVQEQERRHLGRELHDQIGQMLTGLKLSLAAARDGTAQSDALVDAEAMVADLLKRIRALSLELRPPMLEDAGLVAALSWHVERYSLQTGMSVDFRYRDIGRLDGEVETAAFRMVQEALTNAARHSNARSVRLRTWIAAERLLVVVEDDGVGFATSSSPLDTGGLTGMRERASLIGGTVSIGSRRGGGTTVSIDIPVPAAAEVPS